MESFSCKNVIFLIIFFKGSYGLTCDEVLALPTDTKLTLTDLKTIKPKDIVQCLAHLGKEPLSSEEADYIWKSIIKYHDGIENIPDSVLMLLHYVTIAVQPNDYGNLTLSNIDVVENFGLDYNLSQDQLFTIAERVREDFAGKEPEDYTYYDLMALKQILCQFNRSEIERIHPSAYREAALLIGKLKNCGSEAMMGFATLAVHPKAFGSPEKWTKVTVETMGQVAQFLHPNIIHKFKIETRNHK